MKITRLLTLAKRQAGFTMIELLIVISILGILAVAVLSAINPIEQINRGRDTGTRSDSEQFLSAIDRYYASQGYYPWQIGATDDTPVDTLTQIIALDSLVDSTPCNVLDKLSDGNGGSCAGSNELKRSFVTRIIDSGYNYLSIYNNGETGASTYICFVPQSDDFRTKAVERCGDATGTSLPGDLTDIGSTICKGYADATLDVYTCLP